MSRGLSISIKRFLEDEIYRVVTSLLKNRTPLLLNILPQNKLNTSILFRVFFKYLRLNYFDSHISDVVKHNKKRGQIERKKESAEDFDQAIRIKINLN